jgi:rhodanese-related sulfurtransferase
MLLVTQFGVPILSLKSSILNGCSGKRRYLWAVEQGVAMQYKSVVPSLVSSVAAVALGLLGTSSWAEAPLDVDGAKTVTLEQAKNLFDQGAVFIDVRDRQSWNLGHVAGAVHLDFNADEFAVLYLSEDLDRTTPIVFYTSSTLNIRSAMASFFAGNWGYRQVYYFREGYYSWMTADYPVELKLNKGLQRVAMY